jgi:hypothetical protein
MASIPAQDEFLAVTRKSQEALIAFIKNWTETVRTATPKLKSLYAPLADKLPTLPSVSTRFADKLPRPEDAVASAYRLAEQLLATQRQFAEDLLKATTPLIPSYVQSTPAASAPRETTAASEPKAPAGPAATSVPASPAPKSTAATSTATRTATATSTAAKSGGARTAAARSGGASPARKTTAATSTPKKTEGSRTAKSEPAR